MTQNAIEVEGLAKFYYLSGRPAARGGLRQRLRAGLRGAADQEDFDAAVAEGRGFWALKDLNIAVARGEVLGIIGRNGAGKSTLLKILSRITTPTAGRALVHGRMVSLLEIGTGFHDELSGRENVYLNATILGMKRREIDRKFDEIVAFSGVERFLDTPIKFYSSGMRVRLGFAVAAHLEPDILVVDEVLSVGDLAFQEKCLQKMESLTQKAERTVLFVSHSMGAILNLCPRSIRLERGRLVDEGPSGDVIARYHEEAHAAGVGVDLSNRTDRTGSGVVRFTGLHLEDESGQTVKYARCGDPIRVVLEYECAPEYTGPAEVLANVVFSNSKGTRLFGLPSDAVRQTEGVLWPAGRLVCRLPLLPLMPGNYDLDVACIRNRELTDKIMSASTITVVEGDPLGSGALPHPHYGDVVTPCGWEYQASIERQGSAAVSAAVGEVAFNSRARTGQ
jgi:lipopolysaccharide transport system ATP-binding protein